MSAWSKTVTAWSKFVARIKWHLKELNKTLSNQPSHYSSKRIERLLLFINGMVLLDYMAIYLLKEGKIDELGVVGIFTAQMGYAGYTLKKSMEEAKSNADNSSQSGQI